jgi:hypothetical protein
MDWSCNMNEQERAIARACLHDINRGLEELRGLPQWWASLPEVGRAEFKQYQSFVLMKLNELE